MMRTARLPASRSTLASILTKPGATVIDGETFIVRRWVLPRGPAQTVRQHSITAVFMDSPPPSGFESFYRLFVVLPLHRVAAIFTSSRRASRAACLFRQCTSQE